MSSGEVRDGPGLVGGEEVGSQVKAARTSLPQHLEVKRIIIVNNLEDTGDHLREN